MKNVYSILFVMLLISVNTLRKERKPKKSPKKIQNHLISRYINKNKRTINSLIIHSPKGKNTGTINFNTKNIKKLLSLGIINNVFSLASKEYTHISIHNNKTYIKGRNIIANEINSESYVRYRNVSQWRLVEDDSWNKNRTSNGWNFSFTSNCGDEMMLGGHCLISNKEIIKEFSELPPHTNIKIEAMFHFIGKWSSNTGYLKFYDNKKIGKYLWTNRCKNRANSRDGQVCGYPTCRMNVPVSVSIPHKENKIILAFGTDLPFNNPCEYSYAVSEIRFYVR